MDACSIEDITERADVGKGTFYRHFEDKAAMVHALVEIALADLGARLRAKTPPATIEAAAAHLIDTHIAAFAAKPDLFLVLRQGRLALAVRPSTPGLAQLFAGYLGDIEQVVQPFTPAPQDPLKRRRLACAVVGLVWGFLSVAEFGMKKEDVTASVVPLRQAFLAGLPELLR